MELLINSGSVNLKIIASDEIANYLNNFKFTSDYIPALEFISKNDRYDGLMEIRDENDFSFNYLDTKATLCCNVGKNISYHDIVTLIDYVLEALRQKKEEYCIHGSAVSINGSGLYLMGPISGLGKTTIALDLCLSNNFSFIGDEKLIVNGNFQIVGGVKNINYNKEALKKSLPINLDNVEKTKLANKINIECNPVKLRAILLPIIMPECGGLEVEKWDQPKAAFHLYEEFSRKIRGISRRVNNFCIPIQSIDNDQISQLRSDFINRLSAEVPVYFLKGGKDKIKSEIIKTLDIA